MQQPDPIQIIDESEAIGTLLSPHKQQIGDDYLGYRGHVYRVLTYAMHFLGGDETYGRAIETALVYHDLGLWTDQDLAYLEPSIRHGLTRARIDAVEALIPVHGFPETLGPLGG